MKLSAISTRAATALADLMDFCFAPLCAACDTGAGGAYLCASCQAGLEVLTTAPACRVCAMPIASKGSPCPRCAARRLARFECVVALGRFDEPIKGLIHRMKYRGQWSIAERLADRLAGKPAAADALDWADVVIPVPLHRRREFERGYNQSALVARRLARNKVNERVVRRRRNTVSQVELRAHAARVENMADAFELIDPNAVAGKNVLLVDDVMTSGATLQSLARTLAPAKPARLRATLLAVADPNHSGFARI